MIRRINSILMIAIIFTSLSASAAGRRDFKSDVIVGGGISAPSTYLSVFTNPAGIAQSSGIKLSLQSGAYRPWENATYIAGLQGGLSFVGAAAFIDRRFERGEDRSRAYGGLGLDISPLNLSLGAVAKASVIGPDNSVDWTLGILFSPTLWIQFGITAITVYEELSEFGAGLAVVMIDGVQVVVDSSSDQDFQEVAFKSGIKLYNAFGGFSVSYGTGDRFQFTKGFSAGMFVRFDLNSQAEIAYNHGGIFSRYYGALTFGF